MKYALVIIFSVLSSVVKAQYKQAVPDNFAERIISDEKIWKAIAYGKVQVSGTSKPTNREYILFKRDKVEITDQNGSKKTLKYEIIEGVVDPIIRTEDGKEYEIRFYNKPPAEVMRLKCIKAPDNLHYFESTSYMH